MSPSELRATTDRLPSGATSLPPAIAAANWGRKVRDERATPSRAQDAVLALGRRAVAEPEPDILVNDAVRLIAEIAGTELALIADCGKEPRQRLVSLVSGAADPAADTSAEGTSLAQVASDQAHPIVVPDLQNSRVYSDSYLARQGVRGALVVPLRLQNASFGALGACSRERIDFEVDAIYVAETIAHLVATTMAHRRSEALLQQSRRLNETLYDTIDAIVLVIDGSGCVQMMNRACTEITGFGPEDFKHRPVWTVLAPPGEILAYRDAIVHLTASGPPIAMEAGLLTKHSEQRIIAWRFAAAPVSDDKSRSFMLTGIDVTKQRLAEERAERAKKALAHLRSVEAGTSDDGRDPPKSVSGRSGELASGRWLTENERRLKPRRPFPYRQSIAYMTGSAYPVENDFFKVRCRDIAAGGFSFVCPNPPQNEKLVVALGSPRHLTYLTARVVHVTEVAEDGKPLQLVGCQYTGRAPT
ncbi:MAG: PAS domain S-box protein [Planctomycetaceae bacterium]|nr:PAS domain S-box protein [Planctomycetaceae bacterium]